MDDKQAAGQSHDVQEFKPGDTITPSTATADALPAATPQPRTVEQLAPVTLPTPAPPAAPIEREQPLDARPQQADPTALQSSAQESPQFSHAPTEEPAIQWRASEFIAHDKSPKWYLALYGASAAITALVYLLTKDMIASGAVLLAAVALSVYAGRKPREVDYALYRDGLAIGERAFLYAQFRSFSVADEGTLASIALVPHKRFGQLITLYFDPQDESLIVDFIAGRLPLERRSQDLIDGLMKKIRF